MSIQPLITFKAGECDLGAPDNDGLHKIKCKPTPGYIYLYVDDEELVHFCWRPRSKPVSDPDLDLIMFPSDGSFKPYTGKDTPPSSSTNITSPTNGRIFGLKFKSSSSRHFFWLQSKSQHASGKLNWFSDRDLKIGEIVDTLLETGEPPDVQAELAQVGRGPPRGDDDQDEDMDDAPGALDARRGSSTGGAGADATGGDVREEGHEAREGGADGGRAVSSNLPTDANDVVQNFLRSLGGAGSQQQSSARSQGTVFTTLSDLLTPGECISALSTFSPTQIDSLLSHLPPQILLLAQENDSDSSENLDANAVTTEAAIAALSMDQKKDVLKRVFRSPQLHQSLGSLTMALRDGGLPMVAESLRIKVKNGGLVRGSAMPLGEGAAVEAFLEGVKSTVEEEEGKEKGGMETD